MLRHLRRLKLDQNTVFLQPKPAPRTPTSETVLKRTARAHRDTSEFDFALNENAYQNAPQKSAQPAQPAPQPVQKPATPVQRTQQTSRPAPQKPQSASSPQRQSPQSVQRAQTPGGASARPQNMGDYYRYQNPSQRVSNRTIPLSQMYKPTSNQALMEEEYARRRQAQEAQRRTQSAHPQNSANVRPQAAQNVQRPNNNTVARAPQQASRPKNAPVRTQRAPQRKPAINSSMILFIIMMLLIVLVCVLLLFVTLSKTTTAPILPEFMKTADKADIALLYLKQVIL